VNHFFNQSCKLFGSDCSAIESLRLNINKCNVVLFGRNVINAHQYSVDDIDLEHVQLIKDLGITFDVKLNFSLHFSVKVNARYDTHRQSLSYCPYRTVSIECLTRLIQYLVLSKETLDIYLKNLSLCYCADGKLGSLL